MKTFSKQLAEGRGLTAGGRIEEAASRFMAAGEAAGDNPERLTAAAAGLLRIGRFGKAHKLCMKALALDPARAETHLLAAELYLESKDWVRARLHLDRAEGSLGTHGLFRFLKGRALLDGREPAAAVEEFRQALAAGHRTLHLFQLLSHALETINRVGEAGAVAEEGLVAFPENPTLTLVLAKAGAREGKDEEAWALLQTLNPKRMEGAVAAAYWFEMGAHFDRRRDAAAAFAAFTRANDLKRPLFAERNCQPDRSLALIESSLALDWGRVKANALNGEAGVTPVFLIGFPRSGTTLLDQILDSHPRLRVLEEKAFLLPGLKRLADASRMYPALLEDAREDELSLLRADYSASISKALALRQGETAVDKLPLNLLYLPLIHALFPSARIILALRHPCDVVLSCFMQNFAENDEMSHFLDLDRATRFYERAVTLLQACRANLPLDLHAVRYEDVIDNLEGEARKMIAFLGLPWDDRVLNYREHARTRPFINTPSYHQVVKPLYTEARFRWRRYQAFLDPFLERLSPACKTLGYDL